MGHVGQNIFCLLIHNFHTCGMVECYFYKTPCDDGCSNERERQLGNGTCVRRDQNPVLYEKVWRSKGHLYSKYVNYPGGSSS